MSEKLQIGSKVTVLRLNSYPFQSKKAIGEIVEIDNKVLFKYKVRIGDGRGKWYTKRELKLVKPNGDSWKKS